MNDWDFFVDANLDMETILYGSDLDAIEKAESLPIKTYEQYSEKYQSVSMHHFKANSFESHRQSDIKYLDDLHYRYTKLDPERYFYTRMLLII